MPKNLSDALNSAKKTRNVLSKQIIWESGVSKSQFYRIINGKEAPSPETKKKISEALGIDIEQFDLLQSQSTPELKKDSIAKREKALWPVLLLALVLSLVALTALATRNGVQADNQNVIKSIAQDGDQTLFIKDVTIPDGTSIPINTEFEKIWRVKNTGTVVWKDRYLTRMTPASNLVCSSPSRVPIPETQPGETIDISVTFTTPYLPGSCRTDWKTTDKDGNLYYPDMHGLYSIVVVTAE